MNMVCDQFLPGAGLPQNQDSRVRRSHALDLIHQLLERGAAADDPVTSVVVPCPITIRSYNHRRIPLLFRRTMRGAIDTRERCPGPRRLQHTVRPGPRCERRVQFLLYPRVTRTCWQVTIIRMSWYCPALDRTRSARCRRDLHYKKEDETAACSVTAFDQRCSEPPLRRAHSSRAWRNTGISGSARAQLVRKSSYAWRLPAPSPAMARPRASPSKATA